MSIKERRINKSNSEIELETLLDEMIQSGKENIEFESFLKMKIDMYESTLEMLYKEKRDYKILTGIGTGTLALIMISIQMTISNINVLNVFSISLMISTIHKCAYDIMYVNSDIRVKESILEITKNAMDKIKKKEVQ